MFLETLAVTLMSKVYIKYFAWHRLGHVCPLARLVIYLKHRIILHNGVYPYIVHIQQFEV